MSKEAIMPSKLDDGLAALAAADTSLALAGLEDGVWTRVQARREAATAGSIGVRLALTAAALAIGLAFGSLHQQSQRQTHVAELGVLSEDGLLAPSVRLGGGA
jgi:hypothetical protein